MEIQQQLTREEAVSLINEEEREFVNHKKAALYHRYKAGGVVERRMQSVPHGEVMDEYEFLESKTAISANGLRVARRVWNEFETDEAFLNWLDAKESPKLYQLESLVRANTDPDVLGENEWTKRTVRRVERLGRDLQEINEAVEQGHISREEQEAITSSVLGELSTFQETGMGVIGEPQPIRSEGWLDRVRAEPCIVHNIGPGCDHSGEYISDPHHSRTGKRGIARKESDGSAIPLCSFAHRYYHDQGKAAFEKKYDVTIHELLSETYHRILFGQALALPIDHAHRNAYRSWYEERGGPIELPTRHDVAQLTQ